jgi:hypothetical protein
LKWKDRTIDEIAEVICIPQGKTASFFVYRSSYYITAGPAAIQGKQQRGAATPPGDRVSAREA